MRRRFGLAVIAGSLLIGTAEITASTFVRDVSFFVVAVAVSGLLAGFLARHRGALAGFASVFVVSIAQAFVVLVRSWVDGDLDRPFPDCDPCGLVGYAGRMLIVTVISLATFGVVGAIAGWLGEQAAARRAIQARRHAGP